MIYNRILVTFDGQRSITGPLVSYQYDVKQFLVIQGLELPAYYEVDFCNEGDEQTITMVGDEDGVQIPDDFFLTGKRIKAYVIVQGEDDGAVETRYEVTLPVRQRPERTDIDPTPAEQTQIDMMVELMGKAAAGNDSLSKLDAGNLLAEFAEFPTTDDIFSRHVTLVWNDDDTQAEITGSAPGYDLYIPLYDMEITPEPHTPNFPPELEYDTEYLFRYKTTDSNVRLFMEINSEDYEYDHDFLFTVPDGGSLYIALHIPKNTEVDATVTLSMPFQKTGLELEKEFRDSNVTDVRISGTSIVSNGIAQIPAADVGRFGVVKIGTGTSGILIDSAGVVGLNPATSSQIRQRATAQNPITPDKENEAVFYGLASAAGDTTQASSASAVGTYTEQAKTAIQNMLGVASAVTNTASGSIVSFNDGADGCPVKSFVVNISADPGVTSATITQMGEDLAYGLTYTDGKYYNNSGDVTNSSNAKLEDAYIRVEAGAYLKIQFADSTSNRTRIHEYDRNKTWLRQIVNESGTAHTWTVSEDAVYIRFSLPVNAEDITLGEYDSQTIEFPSAAGAVTEGTLDATNGELTVNSTTYSVDPVDIKTVYGKNIISADCGTCDVEYYANTGLYINNKLFSSEGESW